MVKGPENAQRKDTIKRSVFDQHEKTLLETDFTIWNLKPLKSYTVEFQSRAVGIHKYNDRQHDLVIDMLGGFIKTEIRRSLDGHTKKLKSYQIQEEDIVSNNNLNIMRTVTAEALMSHSVYQPFLTNAKQALNG